MRTEKIWTKKFIGDLCLVCSISSPFFRQLKTEMLVLGVVIVGISLVAAALVCYFSNPMPLSNPKPPSSLTDIDPTKYTTRFVG